MNKLFFNCNYHWGYLMFLYVNPEIANLVDYELFATIRVKLESITESLEL